MSTSNILKALFIVILWNIVLPGHIDVHANLPTDIILSIVLTLLVILV